VLQGCDWACSHVAAQRRHRSKRLHSCRPSALQQGAVVPKSRDASSSSLFYGYLRPPLACVRIRAPVAVGRLPLFFLRSLSTTRHCVLACCPLAARPTDVQAPAAPPIVTPPSLQPASDAPADFTLSVSKSRTRESPAVSSCHPRVQERPLECDPALPHPPCLLCRYRRTLDVEIASPPGLLQPPSDPLSLGIPTWLAAAICSVTGQRPVSVN
jgi:hypothetical protein